MYGPALASVAALNLLTCAVVGLLLLSEPDTTVYGSGNVVQESRAVSGFTGVEFATIGTLYIQVGDEETLVIEAEENLIEHIETNVVDGRLEIDTRNGSDLLATTGIDYYLTVTNIETIVVSSSGNVYAPDLEAESFLFVVDSSGDLTLGDLDGDMATVRISGSGDVALGTLQVEALDVTIDGSGNLQVVGGVVERQRVNISGSGDYSARELDSLEAEVYLVSSGSATMQVRDYLRAVLRSSGDLSYTGNPMADTVILSSGRVMSLGY